MFTNADLLRELRKPGKVEMPVNSEHDAFYILIVKSDLIDLVTPRVPTDKAAWAITRVEGDITTLNINREDDVA